MGRGQLAGSLTDLGGGIFDMLCFVEGDEMEMVGGEVFEIAGEQCVGGEDEIVLRDQMEIIVSLRPLQ